MSFLVEDHDDEATLKEALAFIDSLEVQSSASSSDFNMNIPPPNSGTRTAQDSEAAKLKIKKKKRTNLSSSTRLYQRKKAEVLYLRRRAQELEDIIEYLKAKKGNCLAMMNPSMDNNWMKVAETHFQARLRSEETNRSLRVLMTSLIQVSDALRGLIEKDVAFQARDLEPTPSRMTNNGNKRGFVKQKTLNLNSKLFVDLGNNGNKVAGINQSVIADLAASPPTVGNYTLSL